MVASGPCSRLGVGSWSGHSLLGVCYPTLREELVQLMDRGRSIAHVHLVALAGASTVPLKGPGEAHLLVSLLRDGNIMTGHEVSDAAKPRAGKPSLEGCVGMGVGPADSAGDVTGGWTLAGRLASGSTRSIEERVPRSGKSTEAVHTEGEDQVLDAFVGRR